MRFATYMDILEQEHSLPKMMIYNLNPADNYVFATAIGNFQDGSVRGENAIRQRLVVSGSKGRRSSGN